MGTAIIAILTAMIVGWMYAYSRNTKPASFDSTSGLIKPGKTSAWLCVTFFGTLFIAAVIALFVTDEKILYTSLAIMSLVFFGFMVPSLGDWHDVSWSENGIKGPCKMFGPSLSRKTTFIKWGEITATGITVTQYWYIETKDKRRIYWSYLYRGHTTYLEALRRNRPALKLPY